MNRLANQEPTPEEWERFDKHHIKNEIEPKWLGNMSKEEIRNGYEEVQRELNGEKCTTQKS